jgi:hypothetical protein
VAEPTEKEVKERSCELWRMSYMKTHISECMYKSENEGKLWKCVCIIYTNV